MQNTETLCSAPLNLAQQNYPTMVNECQKVYETHKKSISLFARCHEIYDRNVISTDKLSELGKYSIYMHKQLNIQHCPLQRGT